MIASRGPRRAPQCTQAVHSEEGRATGRQPGRQRSAAYVEQVTRVWREAIDECARAGDTLDLVSRSLHGAVYFRLQPAQRAEVRQWAEGFLAQRGAGVSTGPAEPA